MIRTLHDEYNYIDARQNWLNQEFMNLDTWWHHPFDSAINDIDFLFITIYRIGILIGAYWSIYKSMNRMILSVNLAEHVWCQAIDGVYAGFSFLSNGPIATVKQTFQFQEMHLMTFLCLSKWRTVLSRGLWCIYVNYTTIYSQVPYSTIQFTIIAHTTL